VLFFVGGALAVTSAVLFFVEPRLRARAPEQPLGRIQVAPLAGTRGLCLGTRF